MNCPQIVEYITDKENKVYYYTLDKSAPSQTSGLKYTQPIVITDNVTIRAIAVKEGMLDSEVAVFEYFIRETGILDIKEDSQQLMYISPNPVRASEPCNIRLDIPVEGLKDFYIAIYSTLGEKVYENHQLQPILEIRGLQPGIYIVWLSDVSGRNHQTRKIVVLD